MFLTLILWGPVIKEMKEAIIENEFLLPYARHYKPYYSWVYNQEWLISQTIYVLNREI